MDRRVVAAILLMMLVAVAPAVLFKRPAPRPPAPGVADTAGTPATPAISPTGPASLVPELAPAVEDADADTIVVRSSLYEYRFSTRGGRMVAATLRDYRSMLPADAGGPAQILRPASDLLALGLVIGRDTVAIGDALLVPSARTVEVGAQGASVVLRGDVRGLPVELTYHFAPGDYRVRVEGRVDGVGANGGLLLIGMGPGLRNTESDSAEHRREAGVVVKAADTDLHRFQGIERGAPLLLSGPFEWVAVKSKYFVLGVFAVDSTQPPSARGRLSGARAAHADPLAERPVLATVEASLPVASDGGFRFLLYAGPMEYPRLRALGHEFDDVNPYGWPGFRTIIRPVALGARWLLVWMHESLGFAYGLGLVAFGVLIRILLWPLNQKAMRSSMEMQAIQPIMKELQEKHKNDPQRLQQEMFKLYKERNVNPLGGCWPMLLPWPVLLALFFVFQNSIELRGEAFLWMPDLSRADPLFITPVLMGLSMFGLMKLGQVGMEPNPQMKMMLYIMPPLMTFMFGQFASGLNLYYLVSNLASLPQQWMLTRERLRRNPPAPRPPSAPPPRPGKRRA